METTIVTIMTTSYLVGLSGAVSPGPLLAFNLRESLRIGFWAGPLISLGHALLELVAVILLAFGLTNLFSHELALKIVSVPGGAFLVWMSLGMIRHPRRDLVAASSYTRQDGSHTVLRPLLGGVLVSIANPFWTFWWLTAGATLLVWAKQLEIIGLGTFYIGHILADFTWYTLISWTIASGRNFFTPMIYGTIIMACGIFLAIMGGWFIWTGFDSIL